MIISIIAFNAHYPCIIITDIRSEEKKKVFWPSYIRPRPTPAAPISQPSIPPKPRLPLTGAAAPVNCRGSLDVGGGAADVPFAICVVVEGVLEISGGVYEEGGGADDGAKVELSSGVDGAGASEVESAALLEGGALLGIGVLEEAGGSLVGTVASLVG